LSQFPIGLPYIRGISEPLERIKKKHGIQVYHKPINTLRACLVHPKDKTDKLEKTGIVYQITCSTCKKIYIGETSRQLKKRLEEHRKTTNSAIKEHIDKTGHIIDWHSIKILDQDQNTSNRKIKEAIYIRKLKPSLNRDQGLDLPPIYHNLLSHDLTIGGHVTI